MPNKKKATSFMDLYFKTIEGGNMDKLGLCNHIKHSIRYDLMKIFNLLRPDFEEKEELAEHGFCSTYWASGLKKRPPNDFKEEHGFTPLRQTIVLFCAALNNEL